MGRGHEWTFFQTRYMSGLQTQRKMHNTPKSSGKQKSKIKNKLPYSLVIQLLAIFAKKRKTLIGKYIWALLYSMQHYSQ